MKFEVEVISDGRCIIPSIDGTAKIVADDLLGGTLRGMSCQPQAVTKRPYPKGTRKRRAKAEPVEAQG
jgi:hypothetical protein